MNMQAMLIQAQKMQRELKKAQDELNEKEFTVSKAGIVSVTIKGSLKLVKVEIDEDACNVDDKEMVQEMIVAATNEAIDQVEQARGDINERITGRREGTGF